ncbi:Mu transposase domain-containing protein [Sporolactobacillus inulinus]|uniref:Mu transposase domain-containing protein n=1 Tax=Sporolactobacillus inulinus TaxID=2078 RepID=UPI0011448E39|nr:hypothetical protein [Sporolactobacillus inulinus]
MALSLLMFPLFIYKVDTFSTVKFDYNYYSVPINYVGKDISIKGFGNEVVMIHKRVQIAEYPRCYGRGDTKYKLEHYIDLIERRPRSVFNAKPVKSTVSSQLLEIGKQPSGPKDMVKLLRLCVDYGEDKVIAAVEGLKVRQDLSIELVRSSLIPPVPDIKPIPLTNEIKVQTAKLSQYDQLIKGEDKAI